MIDMLSILLELDSVLI